MNIDVLHYSIGSFSKESPMLETLKSLIADEATRLFCIGCEDERYLCNYMNAYRLVKEGYACY